MKRRLDQLLIGLHVFIGTNAMLVVYRDRLFPASLLDVVLPGLAKQLGARLQ